jgi:hypothetical protein
MPAGVRAWAASRLHAHPSGGSGSPLDRRPPRASTPRWCSVRLSAARFCLAESARRLASTTPGPLAARSPGLDLPGALTASGPAVGGPITGRIRTSATRPTMECFDRKLGRRPGRHSSYMEPASPQLGISAGGEDEAESEDGEDREDDEDLDQCTGVRSANQYERPIPPVRHYPFLLMFDAAQSPAGKMSTLPGHNVSRVVLETGLSLR